MVELHRHLDVSLKVGSLYQMAVDAGLEAQSTSLEAFKEKVLLTQPLTDLGTVLARFTLYQKILDRPEKLVRVAHEVVWDCFKEGTRKVELRFSPSFVCEYSGLGWDDALEGFETGVKKAQQEIQSAHPDQKMQVGLICIATRDFGEQEVGKTAEFYLKHKGRFVAIDLAGNETQFPNQMFANVFKPVVEAKQNDSKINVTIHAGEETGPEGMWHAIDDLGATRIGHGIASIQDSALQKRLIAEEICLEVCPTSNWLTQCVPQLDRHPLPQLLKAGIPVCVNTDDPGIFDLTLPSELEVCRKQLKMSDQDLARCFEYADRYSFV